MGRGPAFAAVLTVAPRRLIWFFVLGPLAAACVGETTAPSSDVPYCSSPDGGRQVCMGCATPSASWADSGALSCPRSIDDYCSQTMTPIPPTTAPGCPPPAWSDVMTSAETNGWPSLFYDCDGFNLVLADWYCGDGTNVLFVYEKSTGKRVAAVESSRRGQTCLAGASTADYLSLTGRCTLHACLPADAGAIQCVSCPAGPGTCP